MTTATMAQTAPTEQEIREAIDRQWAGEYHPSSPDTPEGAIRAIVARVADPFVDSAAGTLESGGASVWEPLRLDGYDDAIWLDLRPTQAVRLMQLVGAAQDRAVERCRRVIVEELTTAALTFLEEHPDAPRAKGLWPKDPVRIGRIVPDKVT